MGKMIDADALKAEMIRIQNLGIGEAATMVFCAVIDGQPEAVVRCRDCEYWNMPTDGISTWARCDFFSTPKMVDVETNANGFCSDGIRKEDR